MSNSITRRNALKGIAGAAAVGAMALNQNVNADDTPTAVKGNIKLGVTRGFGRSMSTEEFCAAIKAIGIQAVDLASPNDWEIIFDSGLDVAVASGAGFGLRKGFNDPSLHDELVKQYSELLPKAAEAGVKDVICFSGDRNGLDDETGLQNCVTGLKRLMPIAEETGVNLTMELLNSKVNHPGYQCDKSAWGYELCKRTESPRMKLLFDIYHMQIMEGDLIRNILLGIENDYISDFHVAGNPGRKDPDLEQEIYYPAIMRAIADTDFDRYVCFEYGPKDTSDRMGSLKRAVEMCDV